MVFLFLLDFLRGEGAGGGAGGTCLHSYFCGRRPGLGRNSFYPLIGPLLTVENLKNKQEKKGKLKEENWKEEKSQLISLKFFLNIFVAFGTDSPNEIIENTWSSSSFVCFLYPSHLRRRRPPTWPPRLPPAPSRCSSHSVSYLYLRRKVPFSGHFPRGGIFFSRKMVIYLSKLLDLFEFRVRLGSRSYPPRCPRVRPSHSASMLLPPRSTTPPLPSLRFSRASSGYALTYTPFVHVPEETVQGVPDCLLSLSQISLFSYSIREIIPGHRHHLGYIYNIIKPFSEFIPACTNIHIAKQGRNQFPRKKKERISQLFPL